MVRGIFDQSPMVYGQGWLFEGEQESWRKSVPTPSTLSKSI